MHSVGPRLRKLVGRQECFCVFSSACKILVFAEGFGLKKVTSGSYVNVSIIKQIFDYIFKFCHCRGYYRCLEVYRNCRWRLVLDFLYFLSSIYYDSCFAFVHSFELDLFVRAMCMFSGLPFAVLKGYLFRLKK